MRMNVIEVSLKTKSYLMLTAALFMLVAVLHAIMLCFQLPVQIGPYEIPLWPSAVGLPAEALLAWWGFSAGRRYRHHE